MLKFVVAALAFTLATGGSFAFAQTQDVSASSQKSASMRENAQKALAAWQQSRRDCFTKAGLVEGTDWRFRPDNPLKTQISDRYWLAKKPDPNCQ